MDRGVWQAAVHGVIKSWTGLTVTFTFSYTLLYIKQITNKNLLYSIGNSTQYSVMAYIGEESLKNKKEWMYKYV